MYKSSHARMFSRPKILFLVSLLFVAELNPYLPFEFLIFFNYSYSGSFCVYFITSPVTFGMIFSCVLYCIAYTLLHCEFRD